MFTNFFGDEPKMKIEYSEKSAKQLSGIAKNDIKNAKSIVEKVKEDISDYNSALEVKQNNTVWINHEDIKKELKL